VWVVVVDDGIGMGSYPPGPATFGLRNMRARAEELGGHVVFDRGDGHGTRVTAQIPG
jgi:signal transduction histidine kinase